jgi:hypothetical protein
MRAVILAIALLVPACAAAQTPYASTQSRQIKALSDQ